MTTDVFTKSPNSLSLKLHSRMKLFEILSIKDIDLTITRAGPECAAGITVQLEDAIVTEVCCVARVKNVKLDLVEPYEAAKGADSHVTIRSLDNCGDRILRKTIFGCPL